MARARSFWSASTALILGSNCARQPRFAFPQSTAARLEFFLVCTIVFEYGRFVCDPDVVVPESGEDGPAGFRGQHLWCIYSGKIPRQEFDEGCRDVSRRVRHRRCKSPLLPNLVERGKHAIAAYQRVLVFLFAAL